MHRRAFLAASLSTGFAAAAGCITDGSQNGDDGSTGDGGSDGGDGTGSSGQQLEQPEFSVERDDALPGVAPDPDVSTAGIAPVPEAVDAPEVDVDALDTYDSRRYEPDVPLVPVEAAYAWYRRRDARFVDARGLTSYESNHVTGAAASPAPTGRDAGDPVAEWSEDERIVTYCGCPHHLSGMRASYLRSQGRPAVFAIDEGFGGWVDGGYPTSAPSSEQQLARQRTVTGSVSPAHAGEFVWVRDATSDQVEPGVIDADGSYSVDFRFAELASDDPVRVETPEDVHSGPVRRLASSR